MSVSANIPVDEWLGPAVLARAIRANLPPTSVVILRASDGGNGAAGGFSMKVVTDPREVRTYIVDELEEGEVEEEEWDEDGDELYFYTTSRGGNTHHYLFGVTEREYGSLFEPEEAPSPPAAVPVLSRSPPRGIPMPSMPSLPGFPQWPGMRPSPQLPGLPGFPSSLPSSPRLPPSHHDDTIT